MNKKLEARLATFLQNIKKLKQQIKEYADKKIIFSKFSSLKI